MDLLDLDSLFTEAELAERARIREFVEAELTPHVDGWFERAEFPAQLPRAFGELGVLGMHLEGYGCAGRSAVEYGLAALELEAGDSRPAHVRLRAGLARDERRSTLGHARSRSRSGCRGWRRARSIGCFGAHRAGGRQRPGLA